MNKVPLACLAAAGVLGLSVLPASAALNSTDRDFMHKAASGGMTEVQEAQLAQQRATSPQVKQFAARMIDDHTQANNQLKQIARQHKVTLPARPDGKNQAEEQKLRGLNGAAFDQAYAQAELRDHQETVALFQQEAASGQDPDLKAFAQQTLPTLQQHLQMAQALNTQR